MGVALHFSLQLANHKSQPYDFDVVCKANNGTLRFHYRWLNCLMKKKELPFLERVAFLLRLSILREEYHLHLNWLVFAKSVTGGKVTCD